MPWLCQDTFRWRREVVNWVYWAWRQGALPQAASVSFKPKPHVFSRWRVKGTMLTFHWCDGFWSLALDWTSPDVGTAWGVFTVDFSLFTPEGGKCLELSSLFMSCHCRILLYDLCVLYILIEQCLNILWLINKQWLKKYWDLFLSKRSYTTV